MTKPAKIRNVAEMGLVKKIKKSPRESVRDCRSDFSKIGPKIKRKTKGARS